MKIAVWGAGAIGGVIGAYLVRAGEDITFIDIDLDHIRAMNDAGLTIETLDGDLNVPVKAMTVEEFKKTGELLDVVFLAVKAQHTGQAVREFKDRLQEDSVVVSLQNGLCEEVIAGLIGKERTIGSFVNLFADYIKPGVIQYGGVGSLYLGELDGSITPRLKVLHEELSHWGNAQMTNNIWGYLWGKLAYTAILAATALVDEKMADVIDPKENRDILVDLARETVEVAHKLKIKPEGFDDWEPSLVYSAGALDWEKINAQFDKLVKRLRTYKKVKSGIWRDLAVRKRKTEVETHLIPVIKAGKSLGVDMAMTERVVEMIKDIEEGLREMSWDNIEELRKIYCIRKTNQKI